MPLTRTRTADGNNELLTPPGVPAANDVSEAVVRASRTTVDADSAALHYTWGRAPRILDNSINDGCAIIGAIFAAWR